MKSLKTVPRYGRNPFVGEGADAFHARMQAEHDQAEAIIVGEQMKAGVYMFCGNGIVTVHRAGNRVFNETACIYEHGEMPPFLIVE